MGEYKEIEDIQQLTPHVTLGRYKDPNISIYLFNQNQHMLMCSNGYKTLISLPSGTFLHGHIYIPGKPRLFEGFMLSLLDTVDPDVVITMTKSAFIDLLLSEYLPNIFLDEKDLQIKITSICDQITNEADLPLNISAVYELANRVLSYTSSAMSHGVYYGDTYI